MQTLMRITFTAIFLSSCSVSENENTSSELVDVAFNDQTQAPSLTPDETPDAELLSESVPVPVDPYSVISLTPTVIQAEPLLTHYTDAATLPDSSWDAMKGSYKGIITKRVSPNETVSQPFVAIVSEQLVGVEKHATVTFRTTGETIGDIEFADYALKDLRGVWFQGSRHYSFHTEPRVVPELSQRRIQLELSFAVKAVRNENDVEQMIPTQSEIIIKDCAFSEDVVCQNQWTPQFGDAWIDDCFRNI